MAIVADRYDYVVGVDTHARTRTLALVSTATGREVDVRTFPATPSGHRRASAFFAAAE